MRGIVGSIATLEALGASCPDLTVREVVERMAASREAAVRVRAAFERWEHEAVGFAGPAWDAEWSAVRELRTQAALWHAVERGVVADVVRALRREVRS